MGAGGGFSDRNVCNIPKIRPLCLLGATGASVTEGRKAIGNIHCLKKETPRLFNLNFKKKWGGTFFGQCSSLLYTN